PPGVARGLRRTAVPLLPRRHVGGLLQGAAGGADARAGPAAVPGRLAAQPRDQSDRAGSAAASSRRAGLAAWRCPGWRRRATGAAAAGRPGSLAAVVSPAGQSAQLADV